MILDCNLLIGALVLSVIAVLELASAVKVFF